MLTIPREKLAYIVVKAREYDAEVPPVDEESGSNPSDDGYRVVLEESPESPTYQELVDAIDGLSELERIELLARTWLGRGDYGKGEWRDALREARRVHDGKETVTCSARRSSPRILKKDCRNWVIRSRITRSAACNGCSVLRAGNPGATLWRWQSGWVSTAARRPRARPRLCGPARKRGRLAAR